jgi:hypothetical protein
MQLMVQDQKGVSPEVHDIPRNGGREPGRDGTELCGGGCHFQIFES